MAKPSTSKNGRCRIGIDVGGTFTDFVLVDLKTGAVTRFKEPSVPDDPSLSVERGIPPLLERAAARPRDVELIVHGTTLAVNAIIQRRGARLALVVSRGNRGILEIGRGSLPNSYDYTLKKEEPLVTRDLVFEVNARVLADGAVVATPGDDELDQLAADIRAEGVDAVTVLLLNAFAHPELEARVADALRRRLGGLPVTESARVWPERREFERATVALMNTYVQPLMVDYLQKLSARVDRLGIAAPIFITASNGGTLGIETARQRPVDTILSGPASGVVAAIRAGAETGRKRLITLDMGGTSADMSFVRGAGLEYSTHAHVGDFPLVLPSVNVTAIGAGGGSILWVDNQGVLKVGPHSAGADPGPVCYGRGGCEPTVTDCYLVLGIIDPEHFLGGRMRLDRGAATRALENIAARIGIDGDRRAERTAEAALRVVSATMSTEIYKGLARRGEDPRQFTLMAFGGAGPTHAALLAEEARLDAILVPPASGTFCAMGAILADVKRDFVRSQHLRLEDGPAAIATLAATLGALEDEARRWIAGEGDMLRQVRFQATLDMRYAGQAFELAVEIPDALRRQPRATGIAECFHRAHETIYSFRDLESGIEITTIRLKVIGRMPPVRMASVPARAGAKPIDRRRVFHRGRIIAAPVYRRRDLGNRETLNGPVVIEQEDTTVWVMPGWRATVDRIGNLLLAKRDKNKKKTAPR